MLVSTYQSLAEVSTGDERTNQEMLLAATLKVLEWQQGMLSRQAVQVGDQLTFVDPLRTESRAVVDGDAQVDFDAAYEHTEAGGDTDAILAEQASARHQDPPQVVTTGASGQPPAGDADARVSLIAETFAGDLKHEIAALRQALQMEIAELRRELRGDEGKGNVA